MKRKPTSFRTVAALVPLVIASALGPVTAHSKPPVSPTKASECSPQIHAKLLSPATKRDATIELACSLTLRPRDVVTRHILFSGIGASGATLDCNGAMLDSVTGQRRGSKPTILIRSIRQKDGNWSRPTDITIRNCTIKGDIRLQGLGRNGEAKEMRRSSLDADHTTNAQAVAPARITLAKLTMIADGWIPVYLGPGSTHVTLTQSRLAGKSNGPAVYLDAESADNIIAGNTFAVKTRDREQIAVDGSARNTIAANVFKNPVRGGIFLYRNCGEGGTIRHQRPQFNIISGNSFSYPQGANPMPAVWLNSRNGRRSYCFLDPAHPFGSAVSSRDFAQFNTVTGNRIISGRLSLIRNSDDTNTISGNTN